MDNTNLENNSIDEKVAHEKEMKQYLPYIHLSGVLNFIIPFFSFIVATIAHVAMYGKWSKIKEETVKIANFAILEMIAYVSLASLPHLIYSKMYEAISNQDYSAQIPLTVSPYLTGGFIVLVRIIFALVYFKNYQRSSSAKITKYPLSQFPLGRLYFSIIDKVMDDTVDTPEEEKK